MNETGYIPFAPGGELGGIDGGDFGGQLPGGQFVFTNVEDFRKAVTAGYGTDVAALTGGASLRLQSIEPTLIRTVQDQDHFAFYKKAAASNAGATVDEFTVKTAIGGYPGSGFNSELGDINDTQGTYARKVGYVKFLMTKREVSVVQQSQKTLVDTIAEEKVDATLELLTSVEWAAFYGDSSVNELEFDGLKKTIIDTADTDLIKDARGKGLSYVAQEIIDLTAAIASFGRFGTATDLFCSYAVKAAELDQKLDPAFRTGAGNQKVGSPVDGIKTSHGEVKVTQDVFIQESGMPFEAMPAPYTSIPTNSNAPAVPTSAAGTPGAHASSLFTAEHAGSYYYGVATLAKNGRSAIVKSGAVTVTAGDRVGLVITHNTDNSNVGTGFIIYRSRKNGTNATSDLREVARVVRAAGATTTWYDTNASVPGTSDAFLVNMKPGQSAVGFRRLLPMTMFPLYPTSKATRPWAQLLFLYLRVTKPRQVAMIRNVLPANAAWRPF